MSPFKRAYCLKPRRTLVPLAVVVPWQYGVVLNACATARIDGLTGGRGRLRAILMTATAMIAGMIPLALGTGERAQTAPLGRAVIGGLFMATLATLIVLPAVYTLVQSRVHTLSPTLDPDDPASTHYEPRK